jgi:hypothetical protein
LVKPVTVADFGRQRYRFQHIISNRHDLTAAVRWEVSMQSMRS